MKINLLKIRLVRKANPQIRFSDWLSDLVKVAPEHQKRWIFDSLKSKKMVHIFGRYFFPHIIKTGVYEDTPDFHIQLIEILSSPEHRAAIEPRGHAKTTWERIDSLHDIVYGHEAVIMFYGNTATDAQYNLESIKSELENNEKLIGIYGELRPPNFRFSKKWTNKHIETVNGVNMLARGAGKGRGVNIKNKRPTKIVFDDIEDDEQVRSKERRAKLNHWIYNVIFPSLDKERGKIKFIGTVLSPLCEVLKFYKGYGGVKRKAIENGKSIWPQVFTLADLYGIRDGYTNALGEFVAGIGTRVFNQEYLNTPQADGLSIIKKEWIEENYFETLADPGHVEKVIMLDPQAGQKADADSYGLSVVARYKRDRHRYITVSRKGKTTQLKQAALLVGLYQEEKKQGKVLMVGVEMVMTQVAVYQLILDWIAGLIELPGVNNKDRHIPIVAVNPEGKDKQARLEAHEAAFERGEIHLHSSLKSLGENLTLFPDVEHDDDIDSMVYGLDWSYKNPDISSSDNSDKNIPAPIMAGIRNKTF